MKIEKCSKQKNKTVNKGFTLIELLVVVLIIGILAAIALPQYQMAVAKSKFSTVKTNVAAMEQSLKNYLLTTGNLPEKLTDLDINFAGTYLYGTNYKTIDLPDGSRLSIETYPNAFSYLRGTVKIRKVGITFNILIYNTGRTSREIAVDTLNTNHLASQLASQETNNNNPRIMNYYMIYYYR